MAFLGSWRGRFVSGCVRPEGLPRPVVETVALLFQDENIAAFSIGLTGHPFRQCSMISMGLPLSQGAGLPLYVLALFVKALASRFGVVEPNRRYEARNGGAG